MPLGSAHRGRYMDAMPSVALPSANPQCPDPQAGVLAFLAQALPGAPPERIDTHGAIILLTPSRAYKLKRAVRFSFMDFSTLALREAALRAELDLNRRTAPGLYRRVLPVTREPDGQLALDGAGTPVEWLLEMERFPAEAQLDRVADRGELTPELVDALAEAIFAFHAAAPVRTDRGGSAAMRAVIDGNAGDLASLLSIGLATDEVGALARRTSAELARHVALLDARRAAGRVRRCHGDLHLANIVLLDGRPVLFDCIEFSEEIACIDVLYDLAFLLMDLIERGLPEAAHGLLQAYQDRSLEDAGLALLPLFISVRAAIRAKVAGFSASRLDSGGRAERLATAHTYLDLALRALEPSAPRLVVVAGLSGTGKSSVARALAPSLPPIPGAVLLRSDVIRKRLLGRVPTERLPPEAYDADMSARVFAAIEARACTLLAAGRSVVADGVYGLPEQRDGIARIARDVGLPFHAVWLEAPAAVLEARVAARRADASDATVGVVRAQQAGIDTSSVAWPRVDAARPLAEVVASVRSLLEA